jgi:hypothetical protein
MALTPTNAPVVAAPAAQPVRQQDINSIMGGWVDRGPWKYWDTWTNPLQSPTVPISSTVDFFTVPIGQLDVYTGLRKTKLQTNMVRSGQFAPPRCLVLMQVGIYLVSTNTKATNDQLLNACYLEMKIDDKIFYEGQPWLFPSGAGLMGHAASASTDQYWTNGFPAPQATWRSPEFAKYIAPIQQFSVQLIFPGTPPTMTTPFSVVIFLDGLTDRSVQ